MGPSALPARDDHAEDAFVAAWADDPDPDALIALIGEVVAARRFLLAGRLFQLLDDDLDPEPGSALDRAARAARLWLAPGQRPEDVSWSELDEAWEEARKSRVRRIKRRQRDALEHPLGVPRRPRRR